MSALLNAVPTPDQLLDVSTEQLFRVRWRGWFYRKGAERMYGWTAEEAVGAEIHHLLKTLFPEPLYRVREKLQQYGEWDGELTHTRKDGSTLTVFSRKIVSRDDRGDAIFVLESNTDITERKRAEHALQQAEEQARRRFAELEAIYNTAPLGLCFIDTELRYRRINPRLAEINGKSVEEHIGKTVREIVPGVAEQAEQALRAVLQTGRPLQFEFRAELPTKPGVQGIWDQQWYPLRDAEGKIIGIGVVAEDVTERRQLEQAVRENEHRFRSFVEATGHVIWRMNDRGEVDQPIPSQLEAFVYSIAHDLRAPLRATQMLMETASETQIPMLQRIASSATYMDRMIIDLLDYGRTASTDITFARAPIQNAWQSALAHNSVAIQQTNAHIQYNGSFQPSAHPNPSSSRPCPASLPTP